jgi:hypothetical protein
VAIISAMTAAQLQLLQHFLQEMEGEGVTALPDIRARLSSELTRRRAEMRLLQPRKLMGSTRRPAAEPCPNCGQPLSITAADSLLIRACRACRWSAIVEER